MKPTVATSARGKQQATRQPSTVSALHCDLLPILTRFVDPNVSDEARAHAEQVLQADSGDNTDPTRRAAGYKAALHSTFISSRLVCTPLTFLLRSQCR